MLTMSYHYNAILADKRFTLRRHDFNNNAKFTLIEMLTNIKQVTNETVKEILKLS